jgi:hypothetical protein
MRFAPIETPEGLAALEQLRVLGFRLDSSGSAHRLLRSDGSQVNVYRLDGKDCPTGMLGNIPDITRSDAAVAALKIAKASLADQAARSKLPQFQNPPINRKPYG